MASGSTSCAGTRYTETAPSCGSSSKATSQGYVLRVPSNFHLTLARGADVTCAEAVRSLLKSTRRWEVRSAGKGSKGDRWYGWAWLATASPRHYLLVRRHIKTGELAFHYCYVPGGQALTLTRLVRAAGLRWPVEESFRVQQRLLRAGPVPGPPLHRDRPPHRPRHGRPGHLRHHRRLTERPHRHPGAATSNAWPAPATRPGNDPADRPRGQTPARCRHHHATPAWPHRTLVRLDPPPPGPLTLVPPARQTRQKHRDRPGQLAKCGCRTR